MLSSYGGEERKPGDRSLTKKNWYYKRIGVMREVKIHRSYTDIRNIASLVEIFGRA